VSFPGLPRAVKPGDNLIVNDGLVHLEVEAVAGRDVRCRVLRRQDVLDVTTRCYTAEIYPDDDHLSPDGRVMAVLHRLRRRSRRIALRGAN
jgi:hypothetical protein